MMNFSDIGYDYGIKQTILLVGNAEFSELFHKASFKGMAYKFTLDEKKPVQLFFMFENEDAALKLFGIFEEWEKGSNPEEDAISIDFIEHDGEGYTVAIYNNISSMMKRLFPKSYQDKVTPLVMNVYDFKEIDKRGNYSIFAKNYVAGKTIKIGYVIVKNNAIISESTKIFSKTCFGFFHEKKDYPQNHIVNIYKSSKESNHSPSKNEFIQRSPFKDTIEVIRERRRAEMKDLLPLTTHRLKNAWLADTIKILEPQYSEIDIIKQAICNIVIIERMKNIDFPQIARQSCQISMLDYLLNTYETFDSYYPKDDFFTQERIIHQIKNDKIALDDYFKK